MVYGNFISGLILRYSHAQEGDCITSFVLNLTKFAFYSGDELISQRLMCGSIKNVINMERE